MKYLYHINKWLVIINALLFIIPMIGFLFLIILGALQILMTIVITYNINKLNTSGKTQFVVYILFTSIILILTRITYNERLYFNDATLIIVLIISILLAFLHLNITYLLYKTQNK